MTKSEQCPDFLFSALLQSADELVKDTSNEYWAWGRNGQGQNMLGKLLMTIKEVLAH